MKNFITSVPAQNTAPKGFKADVIDQIVLLRNFSRLLGVELSLVESKHLVEANQSLIQTAHDFVSFVENVVNSRK